MSVALIEHPPTAARLVREPVPVVRNAAGRSGMAITDTLMLLGVVVSIPFAVMLFGLPIVLIVQVLLRLARLV